MTNHIVMIILLILVVCAALVGTTIWLVRRMTEQRYRSFRERKIPHVRETVLKRFLVNLIYGPMSFGDETLALHKEFEKRKYLGFHASNANYILIRNVAMIKSVLIDDFSYFQERTTNTITYAETISKPTWGSVAPLTPEDWKIMRHLLSSYLSSKPFLEKCFQQCTRRSEELCAGIERALRSGRELDAAPLVAEYAAATTAQCVLGCDVERSPRRRLAGLARSLAACLASAPPPPCDTPPAADVGRYHWSRTIARRLRAQREGAGGSDDLLSFLARYRDRHVTYHKPSASIVLSEHLGKERAADWLPTVHVTDEAVASQAHLACLTGYEGSRSVVTSALLELARQPEVQDKIHEEIEDLLARCGGAVTYERLLEMEYLDMVLNEVLRLHPPVATLGRRCTKGYRFEGDRLRLASGDRVAVSVRGLHTDPRLWRDPLQFEPERFNPDSAQVQRHPCAFMPFGRGPRHCIGIRFTKLQYLTALFYLLRRFRVEESAAGAAAAGGGRGRGCGADKWEQPPHCRLRLHRRAR